MYVDSTNWQDADKYFRGCFIKLKESGDTLVLIEKVNQQALWCQDENGEAVCIEINGEETGTIGYELDYVIPRKSYFQDGNTANILTRIPARMWKKGVSKENTAFSVLVDGVFLKRDVSFEALKAYVHKPVYLPYTEATNYNSIALSPRFAMWKSNVYLDQIQVGRYYQESKTLLCKKLFMKDLASLFPGVKIAKG